MRYVKLTAEQARKMKSRQMGLTSEWNKETGIKEDIRFCSSLDFVKTFGYDVKRVFIEI